MLAGWPLLCRFKLSHHIVVSEPGELMDREVCVKWERESLERESLERERTVIDRQSLSRENPVGKKIPQLQVSDIMS